MTSRTTFRARYVFPVTGDPIPNGVVAIEGERIVAVGKEHVGGEIHDLGSTAVLPGLVNTHVHLDFSELTAPLGRRGMPLVDWIRRVMKFRQPTVSGNRRAVALGLDESFRHGVTTLGEIAQPDWPREEITSSPQNLTVFQELIAPTAERIVTALELVKSHVRVKHEMVMPHWRPGLSPHAPYSVHPDLLTAVVELSASARIPVAMHLAESQEELELLRNGEGPFRALLEELGSWDPAMIPRETRPLDYLRRLAAAHRALVVHGNYLDDEEIALLGANARHMSVVYCPRTHDWFAHGDYPLEKMLAAGATVALGTDGRGSSPDLNLLEEMRFVARRHPDVGLDHILQMGTLFGARALGQEGEIGSLEPGKRADLAVVALPDRDAVDPHELLFDSQEPVVACYCRGANPQPRATTSGYGFASSGIRTFADCWFLTGPTASGKSAVGVELARQIDAEIISLDSMALYREMDIGTAKPTIEERGRVPHHLIDVLEPHEEFSLAQYIEAAERCVAEIAGRGRRPLFVGGTPLYLKGLLRGVFQGPSADWELRRRLDNDARRHGGQWLHDRLTEVDPATAARLHPNDTRRLIRALEVHEKTGRPISELQRQFEVGRPATECRVFVLDWPKTILHDRIDRRVQEMFDAGLVEEVRQLLAGPRPPSRTARQAVGYREVIEHLEGRRDLAETIERVQRHTRQLAKRQGTWFRSLSECRRVTAADRFEARSVAEEVARLGQTRRK